MPKTTIERDGDQHLGDADAYQRDRLKDSLLQQHGCLVLRFLACDLAKRLDQVLDGILAILENRRHSQRIVAASSASEKAQR